MKTTSLLPLFAAVLLGPACAALDDNPAPTEATTDDPALDTIGLSERPASLLVVDLPDAAARRRFERTLDRLGGAVISSMGPRLVIAQVPPGADAALAAVGVTARFDRAVEPADLPGATVAETRFLAVYGNRWHADVPPRMQITAHRKDVAPGEAFESAPITMPARAPGPSTDPEDQVSVPYASGTVVVSIVLPESNGAIDPSTEDWTEDRVREAYLKVEAALDRIASAEPNAKLRFVIDPASAPAPGGLDGTVDTDYEFGKRAQWGNWDDESLATADVMSRLVGHPVDKADVWTAIMDYQRSRRQRYDADAAYVVFVGADHNWTAALRAHAYVNGPWTVLDSQNGDEVFTHEFGHIFGALDEYCPDACALPTSLAGYLGVINANAEFREGTEQGGGINGGRGEGASSLMQYNDWTSINGYTRGAWGWVDVDGDGVVDVRDTFPKSALETDVTGQVVRLYGTVTDRPATPLWRTAYSVNRIVGLEVELERGGVVRDVLDLDLPGDTRGRQAVDVALPALPAGDWLFHVRAKNDVGNVEPVAQTVKARIETAGDTAPIPHLDLPTALTSAARYPLHADAVDLDGDAAEVRVDLGADGTWDTDWAAAADLDVTPPAGVWAVAVEARDPAGHVATRRVEVPVLDGDAAPAVALGATTTLTHGTSAAAVTLAANAVDPEGDRTELDWIARLATGDGKFEAISGWGAPAETTFTLPTPERLVSTRVDLTGGDPVLSRSWVRDVVALDPTTVAVAGGTAGVWFVDVSNGGAKVISHVDLETIASHLWRDGNRLYVLGTMLTVVDIRDVRAPREIKQIFTTYDSRDGQVVESDPIPESADWGVQHWVNIDEGDRIADTTITVRIDHPQPSQLTITLYPPKQMGLKAIVLRDRVPGPGGLRRYRFNRGNTPALRDLVGQFAADGWQIEVKDNVADGVTGTLESSRIEFVTRSRAAPVLPEPAAIVGRVAGRLIVAGAGVEALDVSMLTWITPVSTISGAGLYDAKQIGNKVVLAMALESKNVTDPVLRGLCVVDFGRPWSPRIVRVEDQLGVFPDELAVVGSRLYLHMAQSSGERDSYTSVANPSALVNGGASWELGRSPLRVDRHAFGDDASLWTTGNQGAVSRYDVTDPRDLRVAVSYPQSYASQILPLDAAGNVLLMQWGTAADLANLYRVTSTLSRTYQVAVEARDPAGAVSRAYRTVHVIPYDHAPVVTSIAQTAGSRAGDKFDFQLDVADPDAGLIWDPNLLVRVDLDADGVFDTDWQLAPNTAGQPIVVTVDYPVAGTYHPVFEVRDGFWAVGRISQEVAVQ